MHDFLGLNADFKPKFVKRFAELGAAVQQATAAYVGEVKSAAFPDEAHSFHSNTLRLVSSMDDEEDEASVVGAPV